MKIKNFIQRGIRGYSDEDLWSFDLYLAKVISTGLIQFQKENHGMPIEIHNKYKNNDKKASQEWTKIIDKMIGSFEIHIKLLDEPQILKGKEKQSYEEGFKLFIKYFGDLWD
jgi:hypothetical protein